uniref:Zgc:136493 n=1 Tax=Pundamilia nyererei TaxID=303518 RepID=A0A3B4GGG9_9CICH
PNHSLYSLVEKMSTWLLYLEELADIVKQHFQIVCYKDFLQNPCCPAAKPWLLRLLPCLKVVASGGVGIDHLDVLFINSLGAKVANTPGVVSDATADLAMGLLLASARNIHEGHQIATDPKTVHIPQNLMGVEVTRATLGITGMGEVGYKIAQRSKGFEMKVMYHKRTRRSTEDEQAVGASYCENLDDLLRCSDFVMIAVNLTSETSGSLATGTEVGIMCLVVNQDALLALPNIFITPHIGISTITTARGMVKKMVENAPAGVKGLPVPNEPLISA